VATGGKWRRKSAGRGGPLDSPAAQPLKFARLTSVRVTNPERITNSNGSLAVASALLIMNSSQPRNYGSTARPRCHACNRYIRPVVLRLCRKCRWKTRIEEAGILTMLKSWPRLSLADDPDPSHRLWLRQSPCLNGRLQA
jgi:hypothetical protein